MDECTISVSVTLGWVAGWWWGLRAWEQSNIFRCSAWMSALLVLPRGGGWGWGLRAWEQSNIFRCSAWLSALLVLLLDCYPEEMVVVGSQGLEIE